MIASKGTKTEISHEEHRDESATKGTKVTEYSFLKKRPL